MSNLAPFQIFQIYHGCFLHFTTDYDYQKYNGKTSYQEATFERRKDKYAYHNLVREFEHYDADLVEYYIAWCFYNREKWVTTKNIVEDQARFMLEWTNYSKRRVHNFQMDTIKLYNNISPMYIFERLNLGDIHYATLLILNKFTNIIVTMNDELKGIPLWDFKYKKLLKFEPFYFAHEQTTLLSFKTYIPEKLCLAH